jgi:hypothetical protein
MAKIVGFTAVVSESGLVIHYCCTEDGEVFSRIASSEWYSLDKGGTLRDRQIDAKREHEVKLRMAEESRRRMRKYDREL